MNENLDSWSVGFAEGYAIAKSGGDQPRAQNKDKAYLRGFEAGEEYWLQMEKAGNNQAEGN